MEIFGVMVPDNEDDKSYQRQKDKDIYDNNKAYQDIVDKKVGLIFIILFFHVDNHSTAQARKNVDWTYEH